MSRKSPKVLVIEGEIGVGKTTLMEIIRTFLKAKHKTLKICLIHEPVDRWVEMGVLQKFYEDKQGFAFPFQITTFSTRLDCVKDAYAACPDADLYIQERSILTDNLIFMENQNVTGLVTPLLMRIYRGLWKHWQEILPIHPTHFLYLKPTVEESLKRIATRDRDGEPSGVTEEYQCQLRKRHEAYLEGKYQDEIEIPEKYRPAPGKVLVINSNINFTKPELPETKDMLEKIEKLLKFKVQSSRSRQLLLTFSLSFLLPLLAFLFALYFGLF